VLNHSRPTVLMRDRISFKSESVAVSKLIGKDYQSYSQIDYDKNAFNFISSHNIFCHPYHLILAR